MFCPIAPGVGQEADSADSRQPASQKRVQQRAKLRTFPTLMPPRKEKIRPGAWIEEASWILSPGGTSQLPG